MIKLKNDQITIVNDDVLGVQLEELADCVVTDPPYKLTSGGNTGEMKGCLDPEKYDNSGSIVDCDIEWADVFDTIHNNVKNRCHVYTMCNNRNVQQMLNSASLAGFHFHNLLVWNKKSAVANRWYMKNLEFTGFFSLGRAKAINNCSSQMLFEQYQKDVTEHPTEKPVELMIHYIENSTQESDLVFDPFMGSATTAIACLETNRRFIGYEKNKKWFDVAHKRILSYSNNKLI